MTEPSAAKSKKLPLWRIPDQTLIRALNGFMDHDGPVMAGHLAYISLLALFPFLVFLIALAGLFGQTEVGSIAVEFMTDNLPENVSAVILEPIMEIVEEPRGDLLTFGILFAIWTAASGLEAVRSVLNRALGGVEARPIWRRRLTSMGFVIVGAGLVIIAVMALVLGPVAFETLQDYMAWPDLWGQIWFWLRYSVSAVIYLTVIITLYKLLPARPLPILRLLPGALVSMGLWLAAASAFSSYLNLAGDFTVTYGSLGGIIVALLFFFLMGAIFVFGAEVNAALDHILRERHATDEDEPVPSMPA